MKMLHTLDSKSKEKRWDHIGLSEFHLLSYLPKLFGCITFGHKYLTNLTYGKMIIMSN